MYDGGDVIFVFDDSSSLTNRYLHGDVVDQVFADETSSEVLWALTDNQGTVRDVLNYDPTQDESTVLNHRKFDAYGNITAESNSSIEFRYAYTGRYFDADTGLQYNRARWYDAQVGRWLSEAPLGNVLTETDPLGNVTTYGYDLETWLDGQTLVNTIDTSYDAVDRITSISDDDSAYAYVYGPDGRLVYVDNAGTPGVPNVTLHASYDLAGNRTWLGATVGLSDDFQNAYTYDELHRLTRIEQSGQTVSEKRVDLAYNAASEYTTISRYEDLAATQLVATSTYTHDAAGRLTALTHAKGANTLAAYSWTYDAADRVTQFTSTDGTTDFTYDDTDQLTAAAHTYQTNEAWTYDSNGNRTNTGYSTGTNNRLLSDGTYNYEYDAEGNQTKKTTIATGDYVEYTWDHHNRLTSVSFRTSGGTLTKQVQYTYDVHDRLIRKQVDDDGDGLIDRGQSFVYDGGDVVLVFDNTGNWQHRYLHGDQVDQVFLEESVGEILWGLADNQGTIRDVANYDPLTDTSAVLNHRTFDAFGGITSETNSNVEYRYAYTGRYFDEDTGLQYNRARWYDAETARFLSIDPILLNSGESNFYRYVGNSSSNYTDPDGLQAKQVLRSQWKDARRFRELIASAKKALKRVESWVSMINEDLKLAKGREIDISDRLDQIALAIEDYQDALDQAASLIVSRRVPTGFADELNSVGNPIVDIGMNGVSAGLRRDLAKVIDGYVTRLDKAVVVMTWADRVGTVASFATIGGAIGRVAIKEGCKAGLKVAFKVTLSAAGGIAIGYTANYAADKLGVDAKTKRIVLTASQIAALVLLRQKSKLKCFIAGTPVVTSNGGREQAAIVELVAVEPEQIDAAALIFAGLTAAAGFAGYGELSRRRKKRRKLNKPNEPIERDDDRFSSTGPEPGASVVRGEADELKALATLVPSNAPSAKATPMHVKQSDFGMGTKPRRASLFAPLWLIGCLLVSGWFVAKSGLSLDPPQADAVQTATTRSKSDTLPTRPIEQLRVGQSLPAKNPDLADAEGTNRTAVNPATWKLLKLRAESRWDDGTLDVHHIETLQPPEWIAEHGAKLGATVPIPLDLVEMGSPEDMTGTVVGIEPCPPIEDGPGQVILTTVNHLNAFVFRLTIADNRGKKETLGVTGYHKFYSKTRKAWVSAKDLLKGESLGYLDRPVTVASLQRLPGTHRVYNLTVEREHVYYVAGMGALVHNNGCKEFGSYTNIHQSGKKYHGAGSRARSQSSGRRIAKKHKDPHIATDWKRAKNKRQQFEDEARRIRADGGKKSNNNYNKIDSPGEKHLDP